MVVRGDALPRAAAERTPACSGRTARDTKLLNYDAIYDVYIANVEQHATKPEEVTALALTVLQRGTHVLAPPTEIVAKYDGVKNAIHIRVTQAAGKSACFVDISPDPVGVEAPPRHRQHAIAEPLLLGHVLGARREHSGRQG